MRSAHMEEIKEHFHGVDSGILWEIYMADLCFVNSDTGAFIINDVSRMFAFLLRRTHPEVEESNE